MLGSMEGQMDVMKDDQVVISNRPMPPGLRKVELSENSRTVLQKRYLRRGKDISPGR